MIAVLVALTAPALVAACVGLGVVIPVAYLHKTQLQNAADACALAVAADGSENAGRLVAGLNPGPPGTATDVWIDADGLAWCRLAAAPPSPFIPVAAEAAASIPAGESRPLLTR